MFWGIPDLSKLACSDFKEHWEPATLGQSNRRVAGSARPDHRIQGGFSAFDAPTSRK